MAVEDTEAQLLGQKKSFLLYLGLNSSNQNDKMDTNVLRTCDGSLFIIDDVCIEEAAALNEARNIYNNMDSIQTKGGMYSLDEAIKKICSTESMPQNVRRSERIQMRLIRKECNLASSPSTYEPTLNKTTKQRKLKATIKKKQKRVQNGAPNSLVGPTSQSSNKKRAKVPERIDGIVKVDGKECVAVKWKRQKYVEYISTEKLTDDLKKLVVSYLQSRLCILSSNEENASQEQDHASLERGNFACPGEAEEYMQIVREIPICQKREQCMPLVTEDTVYQDREEGTLCENREDCYPMSQVDECSIRKNCSVKNTIPIDVPSPHLQKINISCFKRQQKLFIEQSGILNNYKGNKIDIKLDF